MHNIFQDPDTFTSVVILYLIDQYTIDVLDWDLETIVMEVKDDFKTEINPAILDKIAVGQLLLKTNMFHKSLPDFINFCNIMTNETGLKESWSPADSYEMTWAVAEEKLLVNEEENFSADILAYMTTILRDEGVVTPPDSLAFLPSDDLAGPQINKMSEDPILFQACFEEGESNSNSLQEYLEKQLNRWEGQLRDLKLKNGSIEKLLQK